MRSPEHRGKNASGSGLKKSIRRSTNLSKEKLYPFVKVFCEARRFSCPKPRTIGRIIADQPDKMRSRPVKLRPIHGIVKAT